jgi:hypothetical protein
MGLAVKSIKTKAKRIAGLPSAAGDSLFCPAGQRSVNHHIPRLVEVCYIVE